MTKPPVYAGDLFVFYGLLKQGAAGTPADLDLAGHGTFLGPCCFKGRMLDLGGFPGVVEGRNFCRGVRYRIDDTSIVPDMDAFEDVTDDPATSLYIRKKVALFTEDGAETNRTAWIYWYNRPDEGYPIIADGNWPLDAGRTRK